eukprot:1244285-Pleurochrysis_carterae.AAC.1
MNVRRAGGRVNPIGSQEVSEFARKEFPSIIAMKRAYDLSGRTTSSVQQSVEGSNEFTDLP